MDPDRPDGRDNGDRQSHQFERSSHAAPSCDHEAIPDVMRPCRGETKIAVRNGERHPVALPVVLHQNSRETAPRLRLGPEETQCLVRLRDKCLLNLDDGVAFLDPAIGG